MLKPTSYGRLFATTLLTRLQQHRGIRIFKPREPHTNISQPDNYRLPNLPKVPSELAGLGVKPMKGQKELYRYLGEERVHNTLLLEQYGIVAVSGGAMKHKHFEVLKNKVNRYLEEENSFAILRVDPPHKPVTSKGGKRMGGGKGSIKTYSSPVKAGRVILEVGGCSDWDEIHPWLHRMADLLPFEAIAVSKELLDRLNENERRLELESTNDHTLEWMIRNNIQNCHCILGPYDLKWFGRFTYKDRHNNKMWNLTRQSPYKGK